MSGTKHRHPVRRVLRWLLRLPLLLVFVILLLGVLVQLPPFQQRLARTLTEELSRRTGTRIGLDRLWVLLPGMVRLDGLMAEDHRGDTLLYAGSFRLRIRPAALWNQVLDVRSVSLRHARLQLTRCHPDSLFNAEVFLQRLSGNPPVAGYGALTENSEEEAGAGAGATGWSLRVSDLALEDIHLRMADQPGGMEWSLVLGQFSTRLTRADPAFTALHIGPTRLSGAVFQALLPEAGGREEDVPAEPPGWPALDLLLESLEVDGLDARVAFRNGGSPWEVERLRLQVADFLLGEQGLSADLRHLSAALPGRLSLLDVRARLAVDDKLEVHGFRLETAASLVEASRILGPGPFHLDDRHPGSAEVALEEGRILLGRDVLDLVAAAEDLLPAEIDELRAALQLSGTVDRLDIGQLSLELPGFLFVQGQGRIGGLPEADSLELELPAFMVAASHALSFHPLLAGIFPEGFAGWDTLVVQGSLSSRPDALQALVSLDSGLGQVDLAGGVYGLSDRDPVYNGTVDFRHLRLGSLLGNAALPDSLSLALQADGRGADPATATGSFSLRVHHALLRGYHYSGLTAEGTLGDGVLDAALMYHDPHLQLSAGTSLSLGGAVPVLEASMNLDRLDAMALGWSDSVMVFSTRLRARLSPRGDDFIEGFARLEEASLQTQKRLFSMDSLLVLASAPDASGVDSGTFRMGISSPILQANYRGNASPLKVPDLLLPHLLSLLGDEPQGPATGAAAGPGSGDGQGREAGEEATWFSLEVRVLPSDWLTGVFLPELASYGPLSLTCDFSTEAPALHLKGDIPHLEYGGMVLSGLEVRAGTDPEMAGFTLGLTRFEGVGLDLHRPVLQGSFREQLLQFSLGFDDQEGHAWLGAEGLISRRDPWFELRFGEALLLHGDTWTVAPGHAILAGPGLLIFQGFRLEREGASLALQSLEGAGGPWLGPPLAREAQDGAGGEGPVWHQPPFRLSLRQFDLGQLASLMETDGPGGLLDGQVVVEDLFGKLSLKADIGLKDLTYGGTGMGDLSLQVENGGTDRFVFSSSLTGRGNDVSMKGYFEPGEAPLYGLDLILGGLDLGTLEGFAMGEITGLQGHVTGRLQAGGDSMGPDLSGFIRFRETGFQVTYLHTGFSLKDDTLYFDRNRITFRNFTLLDRAGRPASLNGHLDLSDPGSVGFSLDLTSDQFLALDIPPGENPLFSGRVQFSSDLQLRGQADAPVLEGSFALKEGSFFDMVIPQSDPRAIGSEGVVAFLPEGDPSAWPFEEESPVAAPLTHAFRNLDVGVNIEVDPTARLRILIDPHAGDYLQLRGGGMLSYGTDPGGRVSLAGRYELTEGAYLMTFYDVVRRHFNIRRGSSILWTGDPMNPEVDLTAQYAVRTQVRELFEHHPGGADDPALRQLFPFTVIMRMTGRMMEPDIRFEIGLPEEHRNALDGRLQARLQELNQHESERNKQAFALLVLGTFLQDNPFEALGEGPGMTAAARTSASRLLSQQLNRLSDRYIRGVDIRFDLQSQEHFTGEGVEGSTRLNMEVSRNFFDERMRITVGGNVELEDERRREASAGDIAGDFTIEYLLNEEGSLVLLGFRKKEFGDLFEGQLIKTGLALRFRRTYQELRDLFKTDQTP